MRISLDGQGSVNTIQAYGQGLVTINNQHFYRSVVITRDQIIADWPPQRFTDLQPSHLGSLTMLNPQILLLGTGDNQQFPHPEVLKPLVDQRIGFEIMDTAAACRTYNIILAEGRQVAAALMLLEKRA
jgi:uncharacterized protein